MKAKRKNIIKIAIDSPAAAGAATLAKKISNHYNLYYLDTGKIYRLIAYLKIKFPKRFNNLFIRKKMKKLRIKDLNKKDLISDQVAAEASIISKKKSIRNLVYSYQINCAYNPPKNFNGSCLDGRDITYKIMPDADVKFFMTANVNIRARRRYKELKIINKNIRFNDVLKNIKKRDLSDQKRKISPLKRTKDSIFIDTSNLTIKKCFNKMKKIIDCKLN